MPTDPLLNDAEVRVLGSLIEKQIATPEHYPLTLNALTHACNQSSNRDPVVSYDEKTVARGLEGLREKNLAYVFYGSESRVPKYKHVATEVLHLSPAELAALCVLLLRGPQTVGEIRTRTGRLHEFADLGEVEATLEALAAKDDPPLAKKLPRLAGQKEARYAHLLAGDVHLEEPHRPPRAEAATLAVRAETEKISRLEGEVEALRREMTELRQEFDSFRKQFE